MVALFNLADPQWTLMVCSVTALSVTALQVITDRKRSLGQGNIFKGRCQEFCSRGGVYLSACWDTHPPGGDTPQEQTPHWEQTPPRNRPPGSRHPPGADSLPNRACWEIRSMRGRYASYWNAILFYFILINFFERKDGHFYFIFM